MHCSTHINISIWYIIPDRVNTALQLFLQVAPTSVEENESKYETTGIKNKVQPMDDIQVQDLDSIPDEDTSGL